MKKHDIEHHIQMERQALSNAIGAQLRSFGGGNNSKLRTLETLARDPAIQNLALTAFSLILERLNARRQSSHTETEPAQDLRAPPEKHPATTLRQKPIQEEMPTEPVHAGVDAPEFGKEDTEFETSPRKRSLLSTGMMLAGIALTAAGAVARRK